MDYAKIQELENIIGSPPYQGAYIELSPVRRDAMKQWLREHGMVAFRADNMRDATLAKCYIQRGYLKNLLTRSDYTQERNDVPNTPYIEHRDEHPDPIDAAIERPATPAAHSKEAALMAAIQAMMADKPAIDEAQIIALIQQHAPRGETHIVERAMMADKPAIDEAQIIALIQQHAPRGETHIVERVIVRDAANDRPIPDGLRHEKFGDVLACVIKNIPVMLIGPAGAGKTTLAHQIGEAIEAPMVAHTGAITSRFELSGYKDAHGNYQETPFRQCFEFGGLFLMDEIDGSDPSVLLWLNNALANDTCAFPDRVVDRHDDFRIIAAANTYGRGADRIYVGRNQLDGASLDRFVVVEFEYDQPLEKKAFGDGGWTRKVQKIRKAIDELGLRHVVSPRATKFGWELLDAGLDEDKVEHMAIWKGLDKDSIAKVRAHM